MLWFILLLTELENYFNSSILATRDDSCGSGGQSMAELNKGIRREMTRLSERWPALLHHTDMWQAKLDDMLPVISASQNTMQNIFPLRMHNMRRSI